MSTWPIGKFKGKPVGDLKTDYLTWAVETLEDPAKSLAQEELLFPPIDSDHVDLRAGAPMGTHLLHRKGELAYIGLGQDPFLAQLFESGHADEGLQLVGYAFF